MLLDRIDLTAVEADGVVREGDFGSLIADAEIRQTKAGNGVYIGLKIDVDDDRKIYHIINVVNPNPVAERIGRSQLKTLLGLVGLPVDSFEDAATLIGKRVTIRIKKDVRDDGSEQPRIAKFLPESAKKGLTYGAPDPLGNIPF